MCFSFWSELKNYKQGCYNGFSQTFLQRSEVRRSGSFSCLLSVTKLQRSSTAQLKSIFNKFLFLLLYSSSLTFRGSLLWSSVSEPTDSSSSSSTSSSISLVTYEPLCLDRHHSSTATTQIRRTSTAPTIPRR